MPDAVRHRSRHTVHAVGKPAVVVIGVPEIGDCENDQKSDKHSHLISPSPSAGRPGPRGIPAAAEMHDVREGDRRTRR